MAWLLAGTLLLAVPGTWALVRARRELASRGRLRGRTAGLAFLAYAGHAGVTALAALQGVWPLPLDWRISGASGLLAISAGGLLFLAGRTEFGSFRRTWGLECDRLVTTGVYRYSRNPQTLGAIVLLLGMGLAGRSGVALLLACALGLAAVVWLPVEEGFLERRFGDEYRRYRARTWRLVGWRGGGGPARSSTDL